MVDGSGAIAQQARAVAPMQVPFARLQPARTCVVLPAYNAERTLAATLQRLPHDAIETTSGVGAV